MATMTVGVDTFAVELQLADIRLLLIKTNDPSQQLALQFFRDELIDVQETQRGIAALRFDRNDVNLPAIRREMALEEQCQVDRNIAQQLANGREIEEVVTPFEVPSNQFNVPSNKFQVPRNEFKTLSSAFLRTKLFLDEDYWPNETPDLSTRQTPTDPMMGVFGSFFGAKTSKHELIQNSDFSIRQDTTDPKDDSLYSMPEIRSLRSAPKSKSNTEAAAQRSDRHFAQSLVTYESSISQTEDDPATELIPVLASSIAWILPESGLATSSKNIIEHLYEEERVDYCVICGDAAKNFRLLRCPCGHRHCIPCLKNNLGYVQRNPTQFPPRCCGPIPLDVIAEALSGPTLAQYLTFHHDEEQKHQRACSNWTCGKPLAATEHDLGFCLGCKQYTCTICGQGEHIGLCPQDKATLELFDVANRNGWGQCEKCQRLVELESGCFHMTCLCGYQFCYICLAKHKTCNCVAADETSVMGKFKMGVRKARLNFFTPKLSPSLNDKRDVDMREVRQSLRAQAYDIMQAQEFLDRALQELSLQKENERFIAEQIVLIREEQLAKRRKEQLRIEYLRKQQLQERRDKVARRILMQKLLESRVEKFSTMGTSSGKGKGRGSGYIVNKLVGIIEGMLE